MCFDPVPHLAPTLESGGERAPPEYMAPALMCKAEIKLYSGNWKEIVSYVVHRMAPILMTLSDVEGNFVCLKPF